MTYLGRHVTRQKRLLASSCLSVRPSVRPFASNISARRIRVFVKRYIGHFYENLSGHSKFG
jgi:hypothetical protein